MEPKTFEEKLYQKHLDEIKMLKMIEANNREIDYLEAGIEKHNRIIVCKAIIAVVLISISLLVILIQLSRIVL